MKDSSTHSTVSLGIVLDVLGDLGVNCDDVLECINLSEGKLGLDNERLPHENLPRVWRAIEKASNDPDIGLHLAEHYHFKAKSVVTYLLMSCRTLRKGIERIIKYQKVISEAVEIALTQDKYRSIISFKIKGERAISRTQAEFFVLLLIRTFSWLLDSEITPKLVTFQHGKPDSLKEHQRLLNCSVEFSDKSNSISFDNTLLDQQSPHANSALEALHEGLLKEYMDELGHGELLSKVAVELATALPLGESNIANIASALGLTERQLKKALAHQNTSFSKLLSEFRNDISKKLLSGDEFSITEIAYLCGYHESSSFVRAFKRWNRITPSQYRKNK